VKTAQNSVHAPAQTKGGAIWISAGIFLSRISGLIRQRIFAHYFGNSDAGDAFNSALKIPNFLQNLLGEGVLSASFIPVYAHQLADKNQEDADQLAGAILGWLALVVSVLVTMGIFLTPALIDWVAPGFVGEKRELTIQLVKIFFPGTGLLVLSAWCLGILNSHRKFFLSYVAPVVWNACIIATLLWFGPRAAESDLALYTAWGMVAGSLAQLLVQLPAVASVLGHWRISWSRRVSSVREVFKNFGPVVIARGVVQVSAYVDNMLASFLPTGAVSALSYAQAIYMLPISLFGMSVSAAELPEMSRLRGSRSEVAEALRVRLDRALVQVAFFIVPSVTAFLFFGDAIVGSLFQSGRFQEGETRYVWWVLAGSTLGLLASTMGRLYSSAFYALKDTRTPLRVAILRVVLTIALGYFFGLRFCPLVGIDSRWGTVGLTATAGVAGWVEFFCLQRLLNREIGKTGISAATLGKLWAAALSGAVLATFLRWAFAWHSPFLKLAFFCGTFGIIYLLVTARLGFSQSTRILSRFGWGR